MSMLKDFVFLVGVGVIAWGLARWSSEASIIFVGLFLCCAATSAAIKARNKMFDDQ